MTNTILVLLHVLALFFVVHVAYAEKFSEYEDTAEHIAKTVLRRYERKAKSWARARICPCLFKYTKQIITFTFFLIKTSVFFAADACYALKVFFIFAAYFCAVIIGIFGIVLIYSFTIWFCTFIHKILFGQLDDGLQTPIASDNRSESTQPTEERTQSTYEERTHVSTLSDRAPMSSTQSTEERTQHASTLFDRTPMSLEGRTDTLEHTSRLPSERNTFVLTNQPRNLTTNPLRHLTDEEWLSMIRTTLQQVNTQILLDLQRSQSEELPNVEISDDSSEDGDSTTELTRCVVCYDERRLVKLQPCQHEICPICAKKLIRIYTARCPLCRSPITTYAK